jgi:hypothetical protein
VGIAYYLLNVGHLLGLFFHPKDGDDMVLRNVGRLSTDFTAITNHLKKSAEVNILRM